MPMNVSLPEGYTLRHARDQDAQAIIDLIDAFDHSFGNPSSGYSVVDVQDGWSHLDIERDTWVILAPDGSLASYGELTNSGSGKLISDGYVHPDHRGKGIGTALIGAMEARAREQTEQAPEGVEVELTNGVLMADSDVRALLESAQYTLARVFQEMRIELTEAPAAPTLPAGLRLRTFTPGQDERAVFETVEAAFADHWNHTPRDPEEWLGRTKRPDFDPSLWLLVTTEDGEVVAVSLGSMRDGHGFINTVGTLRTWRGKGLASALLKASFGAFWEHGMRTVALGVDSQSPTGAAHVYEAAGMRAVVSAAVYRKVLRPGKNLAQNPDA